MGATEAGAAFLKDVLALIPEEQRAAAEEVLTGTPAVLEKIGAGVLRQEDYSRVRDQQTKWWEETQPLVELGQKAKAAGFDPSKPATPPALPDDVVRRADLEQREGLILPLIGTLSGLAVQHYAEFGEPLDIMAIINNPEAVKKGVPAFYAESVATRRAEKAKAAEEKRINEKADEIVRERLSKMGNPNFPVQQGEDYSPLAALAPAQSKGADVGELVDTYNQLVAQGQR